MKIICNNLEDLKLMVEAIDLHLVSNFDWYKPGWGTAGVIITDEVPKNATLIPCTRDRSSGTIFGNDKVIVTPYPYEFAWFAKQLLNSELTDLNPVELFEQLPFCHAEFCASRALTNAPYTIREELCHICNWLIEKNKRDTQNAFDKADSF